MADLAPNPDVNAAAAAAEVPLQGVNFMLDAIGFNIPAQCLLLMGAGLAEYEDFCHLIDKDICDMAEEFSKRTVPNGCMTFGLGSMKKLIGMMHWIQDCFRTDDDPDHIAFNDQALTEAQRHAHICKLDIDLVDTNAKVADPGKFKDERKWHDWELSSFVNYLSVIPGINGIPLSYVIREEAEPLNNKEYISFTERTLHCALHHGPFYLADLHRVHNQSHHGIFAGQTYGRMDSSHCMLPRRSSRYASIAQPLCWQWYFDSLHCGSKAHPINTPL